MKLREPASCAVELASGRMTGGTGRYVKRMSDLHGLYEDERAFQLALDKAGDPIAYEVSEFRPSADAGDMIFGLTRMSPGRIGAEFFMTRGHIHARADRPEVYYGQKGVGLMLMESPQGETRVVEIGPQVICYVPPYWIHRSVNTGAEDFVMMFSYPADSGQDYGIIERSRGMRHRVVADDSKGWALIENEHYVPRSAEAVGQLMRHPA
ncbi:glucose-6-phosphate isomerase [Mesorhizobium sp. BAC0120]|uniref:glucose-6-phosphate isomerase n=1 Tax=Mesorhizobium sp. BAC0120 TaxID=3090670 RepID=UPI00298CC6E1|nr:glucose-6-phosphate isomerase [Mesorhizobium sp. BAC0120]MDW6025928.1 glucose-6-phosphate isomerase [Mesorhizobium sp. BAC0120]